MRVLIFVFSFVLCSVVEAGYLNPQQNRKFYASTQAFAVDFHNHMRHGKPFRQLTRKNYLSVKKQKVLFDKFRVCGKGKKSLCKVTVEAVISKILPGKTIYYTFVEVTYQDRKTEESIARRECFILQRVRGKLKMTDSDPRCLG